MTNIILNSNNSYNILAYSKNKKYQVGYSDNIYLSNNYGINWSYLDLNNLFNVNYSNISSLEKKNVAISDSGKYITITLDNIGILFTSNYGSNWQIYNSSYLIIIYEWISINMSSDGKYQTILTKNNGIIYSNDYSNSWSKSLTNFNNIILHDNFFISSGGNNQVVVSNNNIYYSHNFGISWTPSINIYNGNFMSIYGIDTYICITTSTNIYYSKDSGISWDLYDLENVINVNYIFAIDNLDNVYFTNNNGSTWQTIIYDNILSQFMFDNSFSIGITDINNTSTNIINSPSKIKFSTYFPGDPYIFTISLDGKYQISYIDNNIYFSNDSGISWTYFNYSNLVSSNNFNISNLNKKNIAISSTGQYITIILNSISILYTKDYGINWKVFNNEYTTLVYDWVSIAMSNNGKYQTLISKNNGIFYSNNYSDSWLFSANNLKNSLLFDIYINSTGKYQIVIGDTYIYYSNNYGASWNKSNSRFDGIYMSIYGIESYICITTTLNIFYSKDKGITWNIFDKSKIEYVTYIYIVDDLNNMYFTNDNGLTWHTSITQTLSSPNMFNNSFSIGITGLNNVKTEMINTTNNNNDQINSYVPNPHICTLTKDNKYQICNLNNKIYISSNYGTNWTFVDTNNLISVNNFSTSNYNKKNIAISDSGQYITVILNNSNIFYTNNYGEKWQVYSDPNTVSILNWVSIGISQNGRYQTLVSTNNGIYYSDNYSNTWQSSKTNLKNIILYDIFINSTGQYQIAVGNTSVYYSNNYGANWRLSNFRYSGYYISIYGIDTYICITTSTNIYYSKDYGITWDIFNKSYLTYYNYLFAVDNLNKLFFSVDNGITWEIYLPDNNISINNSNSNLINQSNNKLLLDSNNNTDLLSVSDTDNFSNYMASSSSSNNNQSNNNQNNYISPLLYNYSYSIGVTGINNSISVLQNSNSNIYVSSSTSGDPHICTLNNENYTIPTHLEYVNLLNDIENNIIINCKLSKLSKSDFPEDIFIRDKKVNINNIHENRLNHLTYYRRFYIQYKNEKIEIDADTLEISCNKLNNINYQFYSSDQFDNHDNICAIFDNHTYENSTDTKKIVLTFYNYIFTIISDINTMERHYCKLDIINNYNYSKINGALISNKKIYYTNRLTSNRFNYIYYKK